MAETQNIDIQISIKNLVVVADSNMDENIRKELMKTLIGWTQSQLMPSDTRPKAEITVCLSFPNNVQSSVSTLV